FPAPSRPDEGGRAERLSRRGARADRMKRLPLRSCRVQNFKALRDSGTVKFTPLTVFIGTNGSGKSSLIEGVEPCSHIVVNGLDAALPRWRGFEHVWNHAVTHELRRPADHRPHHTNPLTFHVHTATADKRVDALQQINLGEGGNELFIEREQ